MQQKDKAVEFLSPSKTLHYYLTKLYTDFYKNIFFVYCCLKVNEKLLMSKQIGTGQPHIYPEQISTIPINKYTENRAEEFNNTVKVLFEKIDTNLKLNTLLNSTRNLLLSKMTKIKVEEGIS